MLNLMYITNDPAVAKIAADAGVDRIFIDMEVLGKAERQGDMDTVQSHHTPEDIAKVRAAIGGSAEIMARVNPMNPNSQTEIDASIENGADVIMLPMWHTADDLRRLVSMVDGRAKVMPLLETDTAADNLPEALSIPGIDQMHIGLNDLHLCYHQKFMFQLLTDGTVFHRVWAALAAPARGRFRQSVSSPSITVSARSMSFCPAASAIQAKLRTWTRSGAFLQKVWRISAAWSGTAPRGRRSNLRRITAGSVPAWKKS